MFATVCTGPGVLLTAPRVFDALTHAMGSVGVRRLTRVHAYCAMPDHLHVVVSVVEHGGDMAKWLAYVKRETAKTVHSPGMWERSYWDRHARRGDDVVAMVEYVLNNPVRAGLCERWYGWPKSWSQWHEESAGPDPNLIACG